MFYAGLGKDRRRYQRLNVNFTAFYKVNSPPVLRTQLGEGEIETSTLDVSKGGISFLSKHNLPPWSTLLMKLFMFKMDDQGTVSFSEPIEVMGEVRSCVPSEDSDYRVGVCFKEMPKEHGIELDRTLESALKYYA
ncbi:MAG: PilZ domain-containing protein [Candidatus Omnitrophica bacterium]|nr:PilZ domain-containing protein [Candidatus Omnitrophota bacterium]